MKPFALLLLAFAVAACSKTASSDQSSASGTAPAAVASAAGEADVSTSAAPATAAAAASGAPFVPIDLPVYPGATKDAEHSMSMSSNGENVKMDAYISKDSSATVAAWYKAQLPSNWQSFQLNSDNKTAATYSSPNNGDDGQSVIVTGADDGTSRIQMTTKTSGNK